MRSAPLLLVEDDEPLREVLAEYLNELGFDVRAAGDGEEAMELLIAEALVPVVLVIDLRMPMMTGWELLAALDRSHAFGDVPCIVLTGVREHGLSARRRTAVLRKPFAVSDLRRALDQYVRPRF